MRAREKLQDLEVVRAGFAGAWGGDDANALFQDVRQMLIDLAQGET